MCFTIHKDHPTIKTAKKDIVCYKRFQKETKYFRSPYRQYKYEPGECYYEDEFINHVKHFIRFGFNELSIGLHSYSTFNQAHWKKCLDEIIVECIIPEGAKYMYNSYRDEYISDYLIIGKKPI